MIKDTRLLGRARVYRGCFRDISYIIILYYTATYADCVLYRVGNVILYNFKHIIIYQLNIHICTAHILHVVVGASNNIMIISYSLIQST